MANPTPRPVHAARNDGDDHLPDAVNLPRHHREEPRQQKPQRLKLVAQVAQPELHVQLPQAGTAQRHGNDALDRHRLAGIAWSRSSRHWQQSGSSSSCPGR